MTDEPQDDDKPGYGRPPRRTRFTPGQSGNPRGRPRSTASLAGLLAEELETEVTVRESGRRRRLTKRGAIAKGLVDKAARGDARAIKQLLELLPPETEPPLVESPYELVAARMARLFATGELPGEEEGGGAAGEGEAAGAAASRKDDGSSK